MPGKGDSGTIRVRLCVRRLPALDGEQNKSVLLPVIFFISHGISQKWW